MAIREADATWKGTLADGDGTIRLGGGAFEGMYSFSSRFEEGAGTNPEELIAAAHAGCYSMALAHGLTQAGFAPRTIRTTAKVHLRKDPQGGYSIPTIDLETEGDVPNVDPEVFQRQAELAKQNCPVSKVLAGAEINLHARLRSK